LQFRNHQIRELRSDGDDTRIFILRVFDDFETAMFAFVQFRYFHLKPRIERSTRRKINRHPSVPLNRELGVVVGGVDGVLGQ
jgi:hypothetical protein